MIDKNTTWFDTYNNSGDSDEAWGALNESEPDFTFEWVNTDGWRGYAKASPRDGTGWKAYHGELPGWVTGEWDDAPEGTRGSELEKMLASIHASEVKVIFLPTSNVFSTAYNVFIK